MIICWKKYVNDDLEYTKPFAISYGIISPDKTSIVIGDKIPAIIEVDKKNLTINYGYIDLQIEYYYKGKSTKNSKLTPSKDKLSTK